MSVELYEKIIHEFPLENLKHHESFLLLDTMEHYVNGAIIQFNRIQSTMMEISKNIEEVEQSTKILEDIWKIEDSKLHSQKLKEFYEERENKSKIRGINIKTLFLDIHFYLICVDKVQNLIEKLAKKENNEDLTNLYNSLRPQFKPYNDMRNNLEHIEDRAKPKYARDFGNYINGKFTFGGEECDITQVSLNLICDSYEKVLECVL